jgi:hypothetical protein
MATAPAGTIWGAYDYPTTGNTANGIRVGVYITWTGNASGSVQSDSISAVATIKIYTENKLSYSDSQTLTYSGGAISGSTNFTNSSAGAGDQVERASKSYTYNYSTYGSSPGNITITATLSGAVTGVTPFVTTVQAIPARPGGVPTSPSISASVAGQVRQAQVSWSATADPALTRYDVYRNNDPGQLVSSNLATSFTDSNRSNNETLYYVMYAYNNAGASVAAVSNSVTTPMLPGQPGSLAATTSTFGTIGLTWTASSTTAGYPVSYEIIRSGTSLGTTSSLSFNDTTVAPYTTYSYNVLPSSNVGTGTAASVSATSMGGVAKVWNGTSWVTILPKVWNGTSWVNAQARMWNGTSWVHGI